ncbi:SusC/RagA family TonB-linked outer membrane protein [marine bacterium AO1-C]|nr:SusC/RagA family TonB-linked outer membrane protein [marine bacterium AO1-C]
MILAKITNSRYNSNLTKGLVMLFVCLISYNNSHAFFKKKGNKVNVVSVTGTVRSSVDDAVLPGVNVVLKGTSNGVTTGVDGKFSIQVPTQEVGKAVLVFSFVGFKTTEIPLNGKTVLSVALEEDSQMLEELVVRGYGMQKKSHLTGSISKITNKQLDQIPVARVDDALVGQVSGVNIQMTNPAAGEAPNIRIRGQGSISFDSNPLIVVDGIVVGTDADFLTSLDMNNVESVEVLKDAASSAIYGSRGANGIIMITTKKGVEGPAKISYNSYFGIKSVPRSGILTTPEKWAEFVKANNGGVLTDRMRYIQQLGTYTDWEKVMMDGGAIHSHSISARGGTKNTKYRAALSYLDDEGVLLTDNFEKINLRLNLDTKITKRISFGTVFNASHTTQRRFPIGIHDAVRQNPWLPLYLDANSIQYVNRFRENGRWANARIGDYAMERMFDNYDLEAGQPLASGGTSISSTSNQNALAKVLERRRMRYQSKVLARAYLKAKIMKGLSFKQSIGGDIRYKRNTDFTGVEATRNGAGDAASNRSTSLQFHTISESTLSFDRTYGRHSINAIGGFAYEQWNREFSGIQSAGFENDLIETIPAANVIGASTTEAQEALVSYLGRLDYAYADKYLLSVSTRWDGSSKFGPDNKFGFFPAASVGWRVSEEGFLKNSSIIDELKVRASYGITGSNSGIGEYDHIGQISPVATALGGTPIGFNPINIANSELRWERLVEFNPGIDVAFLRGRIGVSLDYYVRTSRDLLLSLPIPSVTGFSTALVNKGVVENKGFEVEINTRNIVGRDFVWSTRVLMTHNKNTLVDFASSEDLISIVDPKRPAEWIAMKGQPISSFYGYVVEKEIPAEFINNPFYPINAQSQDVYVKDINGDGVIDTDDRTILGSPYPDLIWSMTNTFKYKNFDFSFMLQGSHGAEVRNISSQYINNEFSSNQDYTSNFPDADKVVQRIFTNDDIQDASYVALRNINLGYTLPKGLIPGVRSLRVYLSAQNLLYMMANGYVGYNPEGIDQGLGNPLTYGYQRGPAPIYRTYSIGLNVNF